jgi:hypothetical protein
MNSEGCLFGESDHRVGRVSSAWPPMAIRPRWPCWQGMWKKAAPWRRAPAGRQRRDGPEALDRVEAFGSRFTHLERPSRETTDTGIAGETVGIKGSPFRRTWGALSYILVVGSRPHLPKETAGFRGTFWMVLGKPWADMINACFERLGVDAAYTPAGGDSVTVRVIAKRPDEIVGFGDTRIHTETAVFDMRVSEVETPCPGDRLTVRIGVRRSGRAGS